MVPLIATIVNFAFRILIVIIIVDVVISFFMDRYHPLRVFLDRIVNPLLAPIRKFVPPIQSIDFSPIILLIVLQIAETLIMNLLNSIR
jgi:YggT family protein